jgi:hypothetical protein
MSLAPLVSDKVGCRHELVKENGRIFELNNVKDFQSKLKFISENLKELKTNSFELSQSITIENQAKKIFKAISNG